VHPIEPALCNFPRTLRYFDHDGLVAHTGAFVAVHGGKPPGHQPTVYATGFTNIIDIAFDRHGRLLVLEIFKNGLPSGDPTGSLVRIAP
jgi:hypothetical protein